MGKREDVDVGQAAAADDAFGDQAQLLVKGGGGVPDDGEGLVGADAVPLHQDALGLTDDSPRVSGPEKLLMFHGRGDRDGGLLSDWRPGASESVRKKDGRWE